MSNAIVKKGDIRRILNLVTSSIHIQNFTCSYNDSLNIMHINPKTLVESYELNIMDSL